MAAIDMAVQSVLQKVGRPWSLPKRQKKGRRWLTRQMQYKGLEIYLFKAAVCRPRETVVGGGGAWASLVFCRKHEAGKTRICSHKFQDAKMCRRVEEFWVTTPTRCTQAQCPVPRRSLGHGHKRQGTSKSSSTFCRETVWLRRGGHRGSQRVVGEVRRNTAAILYQTRRKRGSAAAYERLLGAQQAQAHARPKKAGWRPFSTKNPDVLAAA